MRTNTVYAEPYPQEVRAAIYCRLSKDDDLSGPSASIQNHFPIAALSYILLRDFLSPAFTPVDSSGSPISVCSGKL